MDVLVKKRVTWPHITAPGGRSRQRYLMTSSPGANAYKVLLRIFFEEKPLGKT